MLAALIISCGLSPFVEYPYDEQQAMIAEENNPPQDSQVCVCVCVCVCVSSLVAGNGISTRCSHEREFSRNEVWDHPDPFFSEDDDGVGDKGKRDGDGKWCCGVYALSTYLVGGCAVTPLLTARERGSDSLVLAAGPDTPSGGREVSHHGGSTCTGGVRGG